jgi:hypothetical protein
MTDATFAPAPPHPALAELVERHGLRTTLAALARVLLERRRATRRTRRRLRADLAGFSDHMRRDVGLPPAAPGRRHWEIR